MTTTLQQTTAPALPEALPTASGSATRTSFRHTMSNALIITRREVRDSLRDWRIIVPILLLTFFFPFVAQGMAASFANFLRGYGAELIGERTIPFLLMIVGFFPISISLVIALETFVGEKERRSLEPLLSTPLTNTELYIGKTLAAMIPPLMASFGGMTVYLTTLLGGDLAWRPQAMLVIQIFMLTIIQALVMVTGAVVVSSQTTSTRAANLLASFIIIPMTLIINGESILMFLAPDAESPKGIGALWAIMAGMFVVVILLLRIGNAIFNREELLGRMIDQMNIFTIVRKIGRYVRAVDDAGTPATNLLDWYRRAIPHSLSKLKPATGIVLTVFVLSFVAGFAFGMLPEWRLPRPAPDEFSTSVAAVQGILPLGYQQEAFGMILAQNARVLLLMTALAFFSFGVMALVIPPIVYVILGYLLAQLILWQHNIVVFLAAVVPHGIVEIPVILLATAAAFRLGAIITRPPQGSTLGHAWSTSLGDTIKLGLGLVLPGLIIAALLEAYVTFPIAQAVATAAGM